MHHTVGALIAGDQDILDAYVQAAAHWRGLLEGRDAAAIEALSGDLWGEQMWFEHHCGGRHKGQEVMVTTAFASLYNIGPGWDGDQSRGQALKRAFARSTCSIEVKGGARRVAAAYYLDEEPA